MYQYIKGYMHRIPHMQYPFLGSFIHYITHADRCQQRINKYKYKI